MAWADQGAMGHGGEETPAGRTRLPCASVPLLAAAIEFGYLHAFRGACLKGLREGRDFDTVLTGLATGVPTAAVVAWVANSRGDEAIFTSLCVGVVLFSVWNGAAFRTGLALQTECFVGTLGPSLLTRTPLFVILAGADTLPSVVTREPALEEASLSLVRESAGN